MLVSLLKGDREVVTLPNLVKQKNKQTTKKKESEKGKAWTQRYLVSSHPGFEYPLDYTLKMQDLQPGWPICGAAKSPRTSCMFGFPAMQQCWEEADTISSFGDAFFWRMFLSLSFPFPSATGVAGL